MNSLIPKVRRRIAKLLAGTDRLVVPPATSVGIWVIGALAGTVLGLLAQVLRQVPGTLMHLGASTTPWVMAGFVLAAWVSRGVRPLRRAILIATGTMAAYLLAWLVSYHLLFVIRESVSLAAGWRQTAPWLVLTVPASLVLGIIAAISHKRGLLGDLCLGVPIAGSLTEALYNLKRGWSVGTYVPTVVVFAVLLIHVAKHERRVSGITLLAAVTTLGVLGSALFPVLWFLRRF